MNDQYVYKGDNWICNDTVENAQKWAPEGKPYQGANAKIIYGAPRATQTKGELELRNMGLIGVYIKHG